MNSNQTLYIMQGPPGSGKSSVAIKIWYHDWVNSVILSTDNYFMVDGKYEFRPEKLAEYHTENLKQAKYWMDLGDSVIVDNTNILKVHAQPYIDHAKSLGIPVVIVRVCGKFKNTHDVPENAVESMRAKMENLEELL